MSHFSTALKTWRKTRHLSKLDLALEAEVSARHISFLETGRAHPSRDMIARLGDALALPLSTRNQMLTAAGFAPRYAQRPWDSNDMAPVRAALNHMLETHAPYPAFAVDRLWRVVQMNPPAQALFGLLGVKVGVSLLDLIASPLMPQVIENWGDFAHHAAQRLRTESAAQGGVGALDAAADHLSRVPQDTTDHVGPVIPTIYATEGLRLSLFSTITQFGTPDDVALDDLKIEMFFPADAETETLLLALSP